MFFNIFLSLLSLVAPAKIIYNGMHASSSHIGSMLPVAMRMANDGHEVHFLESNSKNMSFNYPSKITNTYCQLPESIILQKVIIPAMWYHTYKPWDFPRVWTSGDKALVDMYTLHKDKLTDVLNTKWDLAIGDELFAVASYAIALKTKERGNPFIMMATCVQMNPMRTYLSLDGNLLHRPSMFIQEKEVFDVTSFISRLKTFTHAGIIYPGIWYYTSFVAIEGLKLLGGYDDFRLSRLGRDASFYFVDEMNPLAWPTSTGNEVLHVGYYCPENKGESLPGDYAEFIEDPKSKGTILIAFGTNVMWEMAPESIVQAFEGAINRLKDYRFVFAFNGKKEQLANIGSNCKVTNWAPQKEILNHNKTVAFVSHGGLKSMKDTICGTVPAVYMPLFAEQSHNSEMARQMGFGEIINKYDVTADLLVESILNIAENGKYKENAIKIKEFMLDRPASSLELVSWATKRSLKHKERFPTFKRKGMYLSWIQYYFMDLVAVVSVLVVLISY